MNKASKKKALKDKNRLTPVKITNSDFDEIKSAQDLENFLKAQGAHFKIQIQKRITNTLPLILI